MTQYSYKLSLICTSLSDPSSHIDLLMKNVILDNLSWIEIIIVSPLVPQITYEQNGLEQLAVKHVLDSGLGIYPAYNLGMKMATGQFCIFINPDDFVKIESLIKLLNTIHSHDVDVYYGNTSILDDVSNQVIESPGSEIPLTIEEFRMPASHQAQLIRTEHLRDLGGYRTAVQIGFVKYRIQYASDFEFYCRSILINSKWLYDKDFEVTQKLGGASSQHWFKTTTEILLISWLYGEKSIKKFVKILKCYMGSFRFHYPRQMIRKRK